MHITQKPQTEHVAIAVPTCALSKRRSSVLPEPSEPKRQASIPVASSPPRISPGAAAAGARPKDLLLQLPNETLGRITQMCDAASVRALRESCRRLTEVGDSYGFDRQLAPAVADFMLYSAGDRMADWTAPKTRAVLAQLEVLTLRRPQPVDDARLAYVMALCPNLKSLELSHAHFKSEYIEKLPWSSVPKLRTLHITLDKIESHGAPPAAFTRMLLSLTTLQISYHAPNDDIAASFIRLPLTSMHRLQVLRVASSAQWSETSVAFMHLDRLSELQSLAIRCDSPSSMRAQSVTDLMRAIPDRLVDVSLDNMQLTSTDLQALFETDRSRLSRLYIRAARPVADLDSAFAALHAPNLQHLKLHNLFCFVPAVARGLDERHWLDGVHLERWPKLRRLDLADNVLSLEGAVLLNRAKLSRLEHLCLRSTLLDVYAVQKLGIGAMGALCRLDLGNNALEGARHMLWTSALNLVRLDVDGCGLKDYTLDYIPWTKMPALERIVLDDNALGYQGLSALLCHVLPKLADLSLRDCALNRAGTPEGTLLRLERLDWRNVPELKRLNLADNNLTDTDYTLRRLPDIAALQALHLQGNALSTSPLAALDMATFPQLRYLDLRGALHKRYDAKMPHAAIRIDMPRLRTLRLTPRQRRLMPDERNEEVSISFISIDKLGASSSSACRVGATAFIHCNTLRTVALAYLPECNLKPEVLQLHNAPSLRHLSFAEAQRITPSVVGRFEWLRSRLWHVDGLTRSTVTSMQSALALLGLGAGQYAAPDAATGRGEA